MQHRDDGPAFTIRLQHVHSGARLEGAFALPEIGVRQYEGVPFPGWIAKYEITTDEGTEVHESGRANWLQALTMAVEGLRRRIPLGDEENWLTEDEVPSWCILPRVAEISWGYDTYKKAVDAIESINQAALAAADLNRVRAEALSTQLDPLIIENTHSRFRKVVVVIYDVCKACEQLPFAGEPKVIAMRIAALVREGRLEAVGDIRRWRWSEVRLAAEPGDAAKAE